MQQIQRPKQLEGKRSKLEKFASVSDTLLNLAGLGQSINKDLISPHFKDKDKR